MIRLNSNEEGFEIVSPDFHSTLIQWNEIKEIVAFKIDLVTYDTIRIGFQTDEEDLIEVDEDWEGFNDLMQALQHRFDLVDDWWSKVTWPAFEQNLTIIWSSEKPLS